MKAPSLDLARSASTPSPRILDLTEHMVEVNSRPNPKVPALRGRTVCNMFFEDSTRTRLSFETAAKRLSADVMTFTVGSSSVNKGESLRDTIETVAAMGVDAFVIRHKSSGVPWQVVALDDRQHRQRRRRLARPPDAGAARRLHRAHGARPAPAGSTGCASPSSATSATRAWPAATSRCSRCSAPTSRSSPRRRCSRRPHRLAGRPTTSTPSIGDVDVLYLLRMQRERIADAVVPDLREYSARFGLTAERAARLPKHALVMHPGPMNRGVEIARRPGRAARRGDHPTGEQRRRGADGGALRPARHRRGRRRRR